MREGRAADTRSDTCAHRTTLAPLWVVQCDFALSPTSSEVLVGAGDLPRASQFLHWMRDHGLRPNAVTLSVLAQGMAQFGARDGLMRFLENMEDEYGVR